MTTASPKGTIHPGAALFSEAARQTVAEGPLFNASELLGIYGYTRPDGCCVLGALLRATYRDSPYFMPGSGVAADYLEQQGVTLTATDCDWLDFLVQENDAGHYADRANLRRDLLGEEGGAA